jgi:ADP-ribose pyrophosphatase YjhB (NUDIX family)
MTERIWKPHVTVAALARRGDRFLLVREEVDGRIRLNQPAGHLEPGESFEQAVIRETLEETAHDFTPTGLLGIYRFVPEEGVAQTHIRLAFTGETGERRDLPLDDGIIEPVWMTLAEIEASRDQHRGPMVLQCVLDSISKPAYPLQLFSPDFL